VHVKDSRSLSLHDIGVRIRHSDASQWQAAAIAPSLFTFDDDAGMFTAKDEILSEFAGSITI
jgi:hypothetical protein